MSSVKRKYQDKVTQALLDIKAVGFKLDEPLTFKSGLLSPVYVDNRRFPFYSKEWELILDSFIALIRSKKLKFDIIAGIETAGIPHSAALGLKLHQPSVFVRKKIKDHGTKSRVEGGRVRGKRVLLIEDHITTGGSSLAGMEALRADGAEVRDCLVITSYGFKEAEQAFAEHKVKLHVLVDFSAILEEALGRKMLSEDEKNNVESWLEDPWRWKNKRKN